MNKRLFWLLFGLGQRYKTFGMAAKIVAKYSYPFFYVVYVFGFCIGLYKEKRLLAVYLAVPFLVYLINNGLRSALKKKRPFDELDIVPLLKHSGSPSFPSNHAACAMVIALAFIYIISAFDMYYLIYASWLLVVCALITGLSRVVCGIHYPKDIALGWFIGFVGWFVLYALMSYICNILL